MATPKKKPAAAKKRKASSLKSLPPLAYSGAPKRPAKHNAATKKKPAAELIGVPGEFNWSRFNPSLSGYKAEHRKNLPRGKEILWVRMGGVKSGDYRPFYAGVGADKKLHVFRVPPALVMNAHPRAKWNKNSDSYANLITEDVVADLGRFLYNDPAAFVHAWA